MRQFVILAIAAIALPFLTEMAQAGPRPGPGRFFERPNMVQQKMKRDLLRRPQSLLLKRIPRNRDPRDWTGICTPAEEGSACQVAIASEGIDALQEDEDGLKIVTADGRVITEGILLYHEDGTVTIQRRIEIEAEANEIEPEQRSNATCTDASGATVRCPTF